jgi:phosphoserine phosphatase
MNTPTLPPQFRGYGLVVFDCDSTLTTIEGIDELGRAKGRHEEIRALTNAAMNGSVRLEEVYERRLQMLQPTLAEVAGLADRYRDNLVADAQALIGALHAAERDVFIVSGGLADAVVPFGVWLGVPEDHIRAVSVLYDPPLSAPEVEARDGVPSPRYRGISPSPLTRAEGKPMVIRELLKDRPERSLLVGDGVSDLVAAPEVDLFAAFTGVVEREYVTSHADVLITGDSLAPILSLALSAAEEATLATTQYHDLVSASRAKIQAGEITIQRQTPP